jgi:hypothetical protein
MIWQASMVIFWRKRDEDEWTEEGADGRTSFWAEKMEFMMGM